MTDLASILDGAQRSVGSHKRCIKDLVKLCKKSTPAVVLGEQLPPLLKMVLSVYKNEPVVDRVLNFLAKFSASQDAEGIEVDGRPVFAFLLRFCLELTNASAAEKRYDEVSKGIRLRSCQLIGAIMSMQPDDRELKASLFNSMQQALVERLLDKDHKIRAMAAEGLNRLQDDDDKDDIAIVGLMKSVQFDPAKDVRIAATKSLALVRHTIPILITRCKDLAPEVRTQAYQRLLRLKFKSYSVAQRWELITTGFFRDQDPTTRAACLALCKKWLESVESDPVKLLEMLHVDKGGEFASTLLINTLLDEDVLPAQFHLESKVPTPENETIPISNEETLLWRVISDYLSKKGRLAKLEDMLPDDAQFFAFIRQAALTKDTNFKLDQLLHIAVYKEFHFQEVRTQLVSLLCPSPGFPTDPDPESDPRLFSGDIASTSVIPHSMAATVMPMLRSLTGSEDDFIRLVQEHVADLTEEVTRVVQAKLQGGPSDEAELDAVVEELEEKERKLMKTKDETNKESLQAEITELREQIKKIKDSHAAFEWVGTRYLTVMEAVMGQVQKPSKDLVEPIFRFASNILRVAPVPVRAVALRCMAIPAFLGVDVAKDYSMVWYNAVETDESEAKEAGLRCLFDLVMKFGVDELQRRLTDSRPDTDIIQLFETCLFTPNLETIAAQGLSKLYFNNRWSDPDGLTRLMVVMFDPANYQNDKLQQYMTVFITNWPRFSIRNKVILAKSASSALQTVFYAPHDASISQANPEVFVSTYVTLTDPTDLLATRDNSDLRNEQVDEHPHNILAITFVNEWLSDPNGKSTKFLIKALPQLKLEKSDVESVRTLSRLIPKIEEAIGKMRVLKKNGDQFVQKIKELDDEKLWENLTEEDNDEIEAEMDHFNHTKQESIKSIRDWFATRSRVTRAVLDDSDSEVETRTLRNKAGKRSSNPKKGAAKKAGAKGKQKKVEDSDDEDSNAMMTSEDGPADDSDSDVVINTMTPSPKRRPTRNAGRQAQATMAKRRIDSYSDDSDAGSEDEAELLGSLSRSDFEAKDQSKAAGSGESYSDSMEVSEKKPKPNRTAKAAGKAKRTAKAAGKPPANPKRRLQIESDDDDIKMDVSSDSSDIVTPIKPPPKGKVPPRTAAQASSDSDDEPVARPKSPVSDSKKRKRKNSPPPVEEPEEPVSAPKRTKLPSPKRSKPTEDSDDEIMEIEAPPRPAKTPSPNRRLSRQESSQSLPPEDDAATPPRPSRLALSHLSPPAVSALPPIVNLDSSTDDDELPSQLQSQSAGTMRLEYSDNSDDELEVLEEKAQPAAAAKPSQAPKAGPGAKKTGGVAKATGSSSTFAGGAKRVATKPPVPRVATTSTAKPAAKPSSAAAKPTEAPKSAAKKTATAPAKPSLPTKPVSKPKLTIEPAAATTTTTTTTTTSTKPAAKVTAPPKAAAKKTAPLAKSSTAKTAAAPVKKPAVIAKPKLTDAEKKADAEKLKAQMKKDLLGSDDESDGEDSESSGADLPPMTPGTKSKAVAKKLQEMKKFLASKDD